MARKPMVTRKIKFTTVNVLCLNIEAAEPFNRVVKLPGHYNNIVKLRKAIDEKINTDTEKTVHIVRVLYGGRDIEQQLNRFTQF